MSLRGKGRKPPSNSPPLSQVSSLLATLTPAELQQIQPHLDKYQASQPPPPPPVWTPNPGPQTEALRSTADELYYGGAAGGGKTQLAIGLALTRHRNSLILRRQSVDTKGIVEAIRSIKGAGTWKSVGYGGELRTPDGRLIEVGGCQYEDDWQKYAGRPHDFIDLDELPQFSERQFTLLTAWNRVAEPDKYPHQRCRVVGGGNPPLTPEGEWVLKRWGAWLDRSRGGELTTAGVLKWYYTDGDEEREAPDGKPVVVNGQVVRPRSRTFIPARLEDNPALLGTGYDATLDSLPEPMRSALRHGDMSLLAPDDRWQLIPRSWVLAAQRRWVERQAAGWGPLSAVGVDPARGGSDRTVKANRHGCSIAEVVKRKGKETPDGQSVVALFAGCGVPVNIDTIGIGASAFDVATGMGMRNVVPVVASNSTGWRDPKSPDLKFTNVRAAMMWNVRHWLDPEAGPPDTRLALPPDAELLTDLTAPRYFLRVSGVAVESKDDIRGRIGRSTDLGDAVALACWPAEQLQPVILFCGYGGQVVG